MSSAWERFFASFSLGGGTHRPIVTKGAHTEQRESVGFASSSHPCARRWTTRTPPRRHRPRRRTARGRSVRARGCVTACSRLMIDERVNEKYRCVLCFARACVGTRLTCRRRRVARRRVMGRGFEANGRCRASVARCSPGMCWGGTSIRARARLDARLRFIKSVRRRWRIVSAVRSFRIVLV